MTAVQKTLLLSQACHETGDLQPVIKCSKTVQGPDLCLVLVYVCPTCRWCVRVRHTVVNQIIQKTPTAIYLCSSQNMYLQSRQSRHTGEAVNTHDNTLSHQDGRQGRQPSARPDGSLEGVGRETKEGAASPELSIINCGVW